MQVQQLLKETGTPNPYFYTKRMAEELISSYHSPKFPVAIVRPSLVGCTARAPHPGYFGNGAGPTAVSVAFAIGMATYTSHHVSVQLSTDDCATISVLTAEGWTIAIRAGDGEWAGALATCQWPVPAA